MTELATAADENARLASFGTAINAVIVGASGGIGAAFANHLRCNPAVAHVFQLSRTMAASTSGTRPWLAIDLTDEHSIETAAKTIKGTVDELHLVIVATGILHDADGLQPEKSWRGISPEAMQTAFTTNTIGPSLIAKHFLPLLAKQRKAAFAALSARVGSIGDNRLGGWHAYRASKAALNMVIKTLSIELARRNPAALCVGLHPGTVDTALSQPFQTSVAKGRLFSPHQSAVHLLGVLEALGPSESGGVFAWDGTRIPN